MLHLNRKLVANRLLDLIPVWTIDIWKFNHENYIVLLAVVGHSILSRKCYRALGYHYWLHFFFLWRKDCKALRFMDVYSFCIAMVCLVRKEHLHNYKCYYAFRSLMAWVALLMVLFSRYHLIISNIWLSQGASFWQLYCISLY